MIQGLAFMSHQFGSFFGSYCLAWRVGVTLGLAAGTIRVAFGLLRPTPPLRTA